MADFKFSCPDCGQHIQADIRYAGKEVECPKCLTEFVVPDPRVTTSLRLEHEKWIPPPQHAHAAPITVALPAIPNLPPRPLPAPASRSCGLAIASLALSLASVLIGPFGFIPGIVCGHMARSRTSKDPNLGGRGMALVGLIVGYVLLGVFVLGLVVFLLWITARVHPVAPPQ